MFNLSIVNVLLLCINNMSVLMVIVHTVDMAILTFKLGWDHFWLMTSNCSLMRSCFWCIGVFIEVIGSWFIFLLLWRPCSLADFFFMNKGPLKGQVYSFPSCCINSSLTLLFLSLHPIQSFSGRILIRSWVLYRIWADTVD